MALMARPLKKIFCGFPDKTLYFAIQNDITTKTAKPQNPDLDLDFVLIMHCTVP